MERDKASVGTGKAGRRRGRPLRRCFGWRFDHQVGKLEVEEGRDLLGARFNRLEDVSG